MVRLTDCPNMTTDVYLGCKTTTQHIKSAVLIQLLQKKMGANAKAFIVFVKTGSDICLIEISC